MKNLLTLTLAAALFATVCSGCGESSVAGAMDKGISRAAAGDWSGARKFSQRALELDPENTDALIFHAIVCSRLGEHDPALDAARRAAERAPESFLAQYLVGKLYSETPGRSGPALVALHKACRLDPNNTDARICLINAAMDLKAPQAEGYIQQLRRFPGFENAPELLNQLGVIRFRRGDFSGARSCFVTAFRNDPERRNPAILFNVAYDFDRQAATRDKSRAFYQEFIRRAAGKAKFSKALDFARQRLNGR